MKLFMLCWIKLLHISSLIILSKKTNGFLAKSYEKTQNYKQDDLTKIRDEGAIKFSQPTRKLVLYDCDSIDEIYKETCRKKSIKAKIFFVNTQTFSKFGLSKILSLWN